MKTKKNYLRLIPIIGISIFLFFNSCKKDDTKDSMNIVEIASSESSFSTLVEALQKAGLVSALEGNGPFTVFAPTNAAFSELFNALGVNGIEDLSAEALTPILFYHVLNGKITSNGLFNGYTNTLSAGPGLKNVSLLINATASRLNGDVNFSDVDILASNGVIHVIDKVLLPPTVVDIAIQNGNFTHLVEAVVKADLVTTLSGTGPFTIFAPTDAAFEDLFTNLQVSGIVDLTKEQLIPILLYHVVSGNVRSSDLSSGYVSTLNGDILVDIGASVTLNNDVNVIAIDLQGKNGVVHVIDKVLIPEGK